MPTVDDTFTMDAPATMCGAKWWMPNMLPVRLTSSTRCHWVSTVWVTVLRGPVMPALLTKPHKGTPLASTCVPTPCQSLSLATSATWQCNCPALSLAALARALQAGSLAGKVSITCTSAPACSNNAAKAAPWPRTPPVTTTARPRQSCATAVGLGKGVVMASLLGADARAIGDAFEALGLAALELAHLVGLQIQGV